MFWNFDVDHIIFDAIPYIVPTVLLLGSVARYERDHDVEIFLQPAVAP